MKHAYSASYNFLEIRPLQKEDLESLRCWRNNAKISAYLRKINYITQEQQILWYKNYLKLPDFYFWSIIKNSRLIGALSIYNVSGKHAEIGKIMIGDEAEHGKGYGYIAFIMAMRIGFNLLQLVSYRLFVHENNSAALRIYTKIGFNTIKVFDNGELEMVINKQIYDEKNPINRDIILYSSPSISETNGNEGGG